ncbi:hypothetical protein BDZ85DRAFT_279089 [Elsinoe ampelina]|uniref:Uncharacterized protein n=1 Tax=Elsinoe ampelina TaxID=302913 RepID=A0A6A6GIV4_9PEZI|nr:hypothetical protein BDZ85DRAFT_279089 [Elsinoe ampelina]
MDISLPERIATSAVQLSNQVLTSRHVGSDIDRLRPSGKDSINQYGDYVHFHGGEPSTPRTRRHLYKHEAEQFRSTEAEAVSLGVGDALDIQLFMSQLEQTVFDPQLESLEQDDISTDNQWNKFNDRLFTYTWHKIRSQESDAPLDSTSTREDATHDSLQSNAAARARLISSHLFSSQISKASILPLPALHQEECSHLRQIADKARREQEAVSRADMARLHGSTRYVHRAPILPHQSRQIASPPQAHTTHAEGEEHVSNSDFSCPFPHCHHALNSGAYRIRKWETPSDLGTLELGRSGSQGLMCVHDGCLACFLDGSEWREHILTSHHQHLGHDGDSLTARMQRVWGKRRAVR